MNPFLDPEQFAIIVEEVEEYEPGQYEIHFNQGWVTGLTSPNLEVKVGDEITFWGSPYGFRRGFAINGEVVEYRTHEENEEYLEQQKQERNQKKREEFQESVEQFGERVRALPAPFQTRIEHFMNYSADWGWEYGSYELFCCEEAVKIADHFDEGSDIRKWHKMDHEEQDKVLSVSDEHSGNTFGASVVLAIAYKENPDTVARVHGAMCPLVGCKAYGCYAATLED